MVRGWYKRCTHHLTNDEAFEGFQRILFFVFLFNGRFTCPIVCSHKISSSAIECKSRFKSGVCYPCGGRLGQMEIATHCFHLHSVVDTLSSRGNSLLYAILSRRYCGGGRRNKSKVET